MKTDLEVSNNELIDILIKRIEQLKTSMHPFDVEIKVKKAEEVWIELKTRFDGDLKTHKEKMKEDRFIP
jgi:hypothetical protein